MKYLLAIMLILLFGIQVQAQDEAMTPLFTLPVENTSAARIGWNSDGTQIITSGRAFASDGSTHHFAQVWDAQTGENLLTMEQPSRTTLTDPVAMWSPDETKILLFDGGIGNVWDASTGEIVLPLSDDIAGALWNADATRIVTWTYRGEVRIIDAITGERLVTLTHPAGEFDVQLDKVRYNNDETRLISNGSRGIYVWDATTGDLLKSYSGAEFIVADYNAATDVIFFSGDNTQFLWALSEDTPLEITAHFLDLPVQFEEVSWNVDNSLIAGTVFDMDATVRGLVAVWDAATGEVVNTFVHDATIECCATWNPMDNRLLTADGTIAVWDAVSGEQLYDVGIEESHLVSAAWSPDGAYFAGWNRRHFALWDSATGELVQHITDANGLYAYWSPDGTQLVLTDTNPEGGLVSVWALNP